MKTIQEKRTTSVRKWGNGHGVLLPRAFVDALNLAHSEVEATVRDSSVILTKVSSKKKKLTMRTLVRGMKNRNRHELIDFGAPQGREVW